VVALPQHGQLGQPHPKVSKVIIVDKGFLGTSGAAAASGNGIMAPSPDGIGTKFYGSVIV